MNESAATHSGCWGASAAVGSSSAERERERERGGERERERETALLQAATIRSFSFSILSLDKYQTSRLSPEGHKHDSEIRLFETETLEPEVRTMQIRARP